MGFALVDLSGKSPVKPAILEVFRSHFGTTSHSWRVWVPQSIIGDRQAMESLWQKAVGEPDGIPQSIAAHLGYDRDMTEAEYQQTLAGFGISECHEYKFVAFEEDSGEIFGYARHPEAWDDLNWDVQFSSRQEAEQSA